MGKKPATLAQVADFTHKVKAMARGDEVQYEGCPAPVQFRWSGGYEIPVWIAAYGPRALATAGEHGDGVILQIAEPGLVSWFADQCQAAATAIGKDHSTFRIMAAAPAYFGTQEECVEATRWFPAMVGNHVADIVEKYGSDSDQVPRSLTGYIEKRRGYDYSKHGQSDNEFLDFITPEVVQDFCVLGTVDDHIAKVKALALAGVTQFNIYLDSGDEENIISRYSEEIIPVINAGV
jgi:probable F420-dependent oxidoreductase